MMPDEKLAKKMKLYSILFDHYAPKDVKRGIVCYVVSNSDENIYEWLKGEPKVGNGDYEPCISGTLYSSWGDLEEEDLEFKQRVIESKGRMFDDYYEPTDLYYGDTEYGWRLIKEIDQEQYNLLKDLGLVIHIS